MDDYLLEQRLLTRGCTTEEHDFPNPSNHSYSSLGVGWSWWNVNGPGTCRSCSIASVSNGCSSHVMSHGLWICFCLQVPSLFEFLSCLLSVMNSDLETKAFLPNLLIAIVTLRQQQCHHCTSGHILAARLVLYIAYRIHSKVRLSLLITCITPPDTVKER